MDDLVALAILKELKQLNRYLRYLIEQQRLSRLLGGVMTQIGETCMADLLPIAPGNDVKFAVEPTFSGAPFTTVAASAAVSSSDAANFPAALDPADATGLTVEVDIPTDAQLEDGVVLTWTYTNTDGTTASVTGTYNIITGTIDDVTGGSFTQVQ